MEETLKAVTGDRGGDAGSLKDLAIGNGFSVSSVPSFDSLVSAGVPDFGSMGPEIATAATLFINGLQLVKSLSGKENSALASDKSYEELVKTVLGVSALITGSRKLRSRHGGLRWKEPASRSARRRISRARSTRTHSCRSRPA